MQPQSGIAEKASWQVAKGKALEDFSAVGFFFGEKLYRETGVPVGLVASHWGGTMAESWTSPSGMKRMPPYDKVVEEMQEMDRKAADARFQTHFEAWAVQLYKKGRGLAEKWYETDSQWSEASIMKLPGEWGSRAGADFRGPVWIRRTFHIPEETFPLEKPRLILGNLYDLDMTWVNGELVGEEIVGWYWRDYSLPERVLRPGQNTVVCRVFRTGEQAEMAIHDPVNLAVISENSKIPLAGDWEMRPGDAVDMSAWSPPPANKLGPNELPGLLYNGMIAPLLPMALKGITWYQGESNVVRAQEYERIFPNLILDWRISWQDPDLPFYFVQLTSWQEATETPQQQDWPEMREIQEAALELPNTGMAVTYDLGDPMKIHPPRKAEIGRRLARLALRDVYGQTVVAEGPVLKSLNVSPDGRIWRLSFEHVAEGLQIAEGEKVYGFQLGNARGQFHYVEARIISKDTIEIRPEAEGSFFFVRYAYESNALKANLQNSEGLPAKPFRTDNFAGLTEGNRYWDQVSFFIESR